MAITVVQPSGWTTTASTNPVTPLDLARRHPLADKKLYRWSLVVGADNDEFDTGVSGIVEVAIVGTRSLTSGMQGTSAFAGASGDCSVAGLSAAGVVTFSVAGSTALDLLVWAN